MKNIIITLILCCGLSACFRPYVPTVQQGNLLKPSEVAQISTGMSKQDIRKSIGNPILVDAFNDDLWTYAYTKQVHGGKIIRKDIELYFQDEKLVKITKNLEPTRVK